MKISLRGWLVIGTFGALAVCWAMSGSPWLNAADTDTKGGQLSERSLGNLLAAMGLEPTKVEKRYDFAFKAIHEKEEWDLSMTAVLSQDGMSIWIMAWLDELPRSAADVPRTALLRLLANNDQLGDGKFFAYVASNRRFVLQRVMPNHSISTASFRNSLRDLGRSVVTTYPHWSVANWKRSTAPQAKTTPRASDENAQSPRRSPIQSATQSQKFQTPIRR